MAQLEIQPCTVCGAALDNVCLFEKVIENQELRSIKIYQCACCKGVYLGEYNKYFDDGLYAYYTKFSGKSKDQVYDPLTKKSYFQVLKLMNSYGGGKTILDVGCGNGSFVDAALEQGYEIKGIELSQSAVDVAQTFNLPVENMDFFSSKIQSSSFSVLTMFEVMEHLPEPVSFLKRAEQVVKPGGLIYLTTPNYNSIDRRILGGSWSVFHREHLTYFTPLGLKNAIKQNTGLDILHVETRNMSNDLMIYLRSWLPSRFSKDDLFKSSGPPKQTFGVRERISNSQWLSLLKRSVNLVLNVTGLGCTIVMVLRRPY